MKIPTQEGPAVALGRNILQGSIDAMSTVVIPPDIINTLTLGITNLEFRIADHTGLKDSVRAARNVRRLALRRGAAFLADAKSVLKPRLGSIATAEWEKAGMAPGSLEVPKSPAGVLLQLDLLKGYFTANPTHGSEALNITAEEAGALAVAISAAQSGLNGALARARVASKARLAARTNVSRGIRLVCDSLSLQLPADADDWYSFGLPRPVDGKVPVIPGKPVLAQTGPGTVQVTFGRCTRASRYRVFIKGPGDESPRAVATVRELTATVSGLPNGVKLLFTLVAANSVGQSAESEAAEITLG